MDVSLDDIIKKNKIGAGSGRRNRRNKNVSKKVTNVINNPPKKIKGGVVKKPVALSTTKKAGVSDLRFLIGKKQKPLMPIRDAREKLMNRKPKFDARERLMRTKRPPKLLTGGNSGKFDPLPRRTIENRNRKQAYMDMEDSLLKRRGSPGSLLYRTIDNHQFHHLPSPVQEMMDIDSWDEPSIQDITRHPPLTVTLKRGSVYSPYHPQPPARPLPSLPRSNGVKGRLEGGRAPPPDDEYRIVVSNLQPSVTHEDIKELFEDIGSLYRSRVVRPGTAEVVYKSLEDATKAVDTYHNRQLDGQPMKCLLVRPSNVSRPLATKGSVIPDLHAIHRALFNK